MNDTLAQCWAGTEKIFKPEGFVSTLGLTWNVWWLHFEMMLMWRILHLWNTDCWRLATFDGIGWAGTSIWLGLEQGSISNPVGLELSFVMMKFSSFKAQSTHKLSTYDFEHLWWLSVDTHPSGLNMFLVLTWQLARKKAKKDDSDIATSLNYGVDASIFELV